MTELLSIILAAGEGTRMRSATPKVLHPVGGMPMVGHVMRTALRSGATDICVVVGPNHEAVEAEVTRHSTKTRIFSQLERLGTGHAVRQAREAFEGASGNVVVLYADNPLVSSDTGRPLPAGSTMAPISSSSAIGRRTPPISAAC